MLHCMIFGLLFLGAGCLFFTGHAVRWIKGYQELTEAEKNSIRILPLCRNLSAAFFLAGLLFLLAGLFPAFREGWFRITMIGWFVLCGLDVLYIGKSGRYVTGKGAKMTGVTK